PPAGAPAPPPPPRPPPPPPPRPWVWTWENRAKIPKIRKMIVIRFILAPGRKVFCRRIGRESTLATNDEDLIDIRKQFPPRGSINRLPGEGVFVLRLHRIDH